MLAKLVQRCRRIEDTREWESRLGSPRTLALCLRDHAAGGPPDAFIDDSEFCHLHPSPAGCLHLTLPQPLRSQAIDAGWAEPHPIAVSGSISASLVMVYAPRNESELDVVVWLVKASARFARGC
jgi:hypothetical protein